MEQRNTGLARNVLLIEVDQMNAACLSVLGHPNVHTPNLDRLAGQGALFRHAVCNSPICMPSRISMLSGQYVSTNGQFGFSGLNDARMPWLPRIFQQAGYRTGAFGKFHTLCIGDAQWSFDVAAPSLPEDNDMARPAGLHYMAYCRDQGVPWPNDQIHGHNPYGPPAPVASTATSDMHQARKRSCRSDVPEEHSLESWTTRECIRFLRDTTDEGRPFFAWLTYDRPHNPTTLPEPWFSRVDPSSIVLRDLPTAEQVAALPPSFVRESLRGSSVAGMGEAHFRFVLASYFTLIDYIDSKIGEVLEALESLGVLDNTTIVFTADHGDEAGNNGLYDKALTVATDGVTRVPLIVRPAPALTPVETGRILDGPVELVDLFPTLCRLHDLALPEGVEGVDLAPCVLRTDRPPASRAVVCEDYFKRMIEQDGWKLVFDPCHPGENELHDMRRDPCGHVNLYNVPAHRARQLDLKRRLLAFMTERFFGPYDDRDVDRIERGLDPADALLSPIIIAPPSGFQSYRAGVLLSDDAHVLLVRFYDPDMLLFRGGSGFQHYQSRKQALPFDAEFVEGLLDQGLRQCFAWTPAVSLYLHEEIHRRLCPDAPMAR